MKQQPKQNPYTVSSETAERQKGGNTAASGEKHGKEKATRIPENRRFDPNPGK